MSENEIVLKQHTIKLLDSLKSNTENGVEFWFARDIQKMLGYSDWGNFQNAIEKAKVACDGVGINHCYHFGDTTRMIALGKNATRQVDDIALTRYACYLIAQNADPTKPEIADAMTYFAIQTRRQELTDQQTETQKRIVLRNRVKEANHHLFDAAKEAGVKHYGSFNDAGYKGLYGGFSVDDLKQKKGVSNKEDYLDNIGRAELAANEFRITQTEQKLNHNNIKGEMPAIETHREVAKEVRNTIKKIGGTMPEDLPREESIKKLKKVKQNTIKELPLK